MKEKAFTRRNFLRATSAAGLLAASSPLAIAASALPDNKKETISAAKGAAGDPPGWSIPSCAWSRPLGALPKLQMMPDKSKETGDLVGLNTPTRTKKGIRSEERRVGKECG